MALGKIKADTLEHSTAGSLDTSYVVNGSAKAWVSLNGTGTIAVLDSLNTSSITDTGTGNYTCTWASSYAAVDYMCLTCGTFMGSDSRIGALGTILVSSASTSFSNSSFIAQDPSLCGVLSHGDLA